MDAAGLMGSGGAVAWARAIVETARRIANRRKESAWAVKRAWRER